MSLPLPETLPLSSPLVSLRGIVKRFGSFTANDQVDLDLHQGEVHALLGENGAGKSTLVKMLYGLIQPNAGTIRFAGQVVTLPDPVAARALGIGMVFQHFSLFENLTVAENIALVLPGSTSRKGLPARIKTIGERYGLALEPQRPVWSLSAGERQRIEIARCLLQEPKLLILDEPTSVLTPQEAETLFAILDRLKAEGKAIAYISHKLEEVKRLCERATILRQGKVAATCDPRQESARSLAALMVGTEIKQVRPGAHGFGDARLQVRELNLASPDLHGVALRDMSFSVKAGEILGIAGIAGNGQSELFAALSGETPAPRSDAISLDTVPVGTSSINSRRQRQAAFVPEDRNGRAAVPDFPLSDNALLSRHATGGLTAAGFIKPGAARALAARIIAAFDVRVSGTDPLARTLSGGNLQKYLVGREILRNPGVLVIDQPTWGVDALAASTIRQALVDLAQKGAAVVVISQDLDELFEISDRLAVINAGRLSQPVEARTTTRENIGLLMGGADAESGHAAA